MSDSPMHHSSLIVSDTAMEIDVSNLCDNCHNNLQEGDLAMDTTVLHGSDRQECASYCEKAGISLAVIKTGNNNTVSVIPDHLLVNGCIFEILKTHPSWPLLTSWLKVWMGARFPEKCSTSKIQYRVAKLSKERTRLLKSRNTMQSLHQLESSPFVVISDIQPKTATTSSPEIKTLSPIHQPSPTIVLNPNSSQSLLPASKRFETLSTTVFNRSSQSLVPASQSFETPPTAIFNPSHPSLLTASQSFETPRTTIFNPSSPSLLPASQSFKTPSITVFNLSSQSPSSASHSFKTLSKTVFNLSSQSPLLASQSFKTPPITVFNSLQSNSSYRCMKEDCLNTHHKLKNALRRNKRKSDVIVLHRRWAKNTGKQLKRLTKSIDRFKAQKKAKMQLSSKPRKNKSSVSTQVSSSCLDCLKREEYIEQLQNEVFSWDEKRTVSFLNSGKYNEDFIQCVLTLLQNNVSYHHVPVVIEAVLKLVNVTATQLPCRRTVEEMAKVRLPLIQLNIQETLRDEPHTTLYSDETGKFGHQYETYVITDQKQPPKILGLREMVDKSSTTNLETLQKVLQDLDGVSKECGNTGKLILANIKNTMSDRAATEKSFQSLLADYRKSILPEVIPNWHSLDNDIRLQLCKMHNFFCGLHLLVNTAEKAAQTLNMWENKLKREEDINKEDSEVVNFIRVSCRAFSRGGDGKCGFFGKVAPFLKSRNIEESLTRFKGNRFNIIFHNAAVLYHLHPHLLDFIDNCLGTPNQLAATVLSHLKSDVAVAGCRALGLLNKLLTKPLWNILESEGNILQMNEIYVYIIDSLRNTPSSRVLAGEAIFVPNYVKEDTAIFKSLTKSCDNDALTEGILEILMVDIADLFNRLLKDQLPGGENYGKTSDTHPECISSLKHNKLPESVFGRLDYSLHHKPSASIFTHECSILYNFNKVGSWLDGMDDEMRRNTITNASSLKNTTYATFKKRQNEIKQQKLEILKQKEEEMRLKKQRIVKRKLQQTDAIVFHGLWQSVEDVDVRLETYGTKNAKLTALKAQLNFRKNVMKQHADTYLYAFSLKNKPSTCQQLTENLKKLILEAGDGS